MAAALLLITCSSAASDRVTITKEPVSFELAVPSEGRPVLHLNDVRLAAGHSGVLEVHANGTRVTELYIVPSRSDAPSAAGQNLVVPLPENLRDRVTITLAPKHETRMTLLRPSISAGR